MADICPSCGLPLDENGKCSLCDMPKDPTGALEFDAHTLLVEDVSELTASKPEKASAAKAQSETPAPSAPPTAEAPSKQPAAFAPSNAAPRQENQKKQKPPKPPKSQKPQKKNNTVLFVVIAALAVCCVVAGVLAAFRFHWFGLGENGKSTADSAQPGEQSGDEIKAKTVPLAISQNDAVLRTASFGKVGGYWNFDAVTEEEQSAEAVRYGMSFDSGLMCADGDTFYGVTDGNYDEWKKVTVTGQNSIKTENWINNEKLGRLNLAGKGNVFEGFRADGDWIYVRVAENLSGDPSNSYSLVRAKKDGSTIEFVCDDNRTRLRAVEFAVNDGWIYYSYNGYTFDDSQISYTKDLAGVYKIKTDGTGKQALLKPQTLGNGWQQGLTKNLTYFDNKLYYVGNEDKNSRLYCVDTEGGSPEKLSNYSVDAFAVDSADRMLYFLNKEDVVGESSATGSLLLYALDLKQEATEATPTDAYLSCRRMTAADGYLYVESTGGTYEYQRVSLKDYKTQYLAENNGTVCWKNTAIDSADTTDLPEEQYGNDSGELPSDNNLGEIPDAADENGVYNVYNEAENGDEGTLE